MWQCSLVVVVVVVVSNTQALGGIPFSINYPGIILQVVELFWEVLYVYWILLQSSFFETCS